jgi:hypothetical protein
MSFKTRSITKTKQSWDNLQRYVAFACRDSGKQRKASHRTAGLRAEVSTPNLQVRESSKLLCSDVRYHVRNRAKDGGGGNGRGVAYTSSPSSAKIKNGQRYLHSPTRLHCAALRSKGSVTCTFIRCSVQTEKGECGCGGHQDGASRSLSSICVGRIGEQYNHRHVQISKAKYVLS